MSDIDKARMAREARETVGAERPAAGENRVQAAMRRYLGAAAFRSQDRDHKDDKATAESKKPDNPWTTG